MVGVKTVAAANEVVARRQGGGCCCCQRPGHREITGGDRGQLRMTTGAVLLQGCWTDHGPGGQQASRCRGRHLREDLRFYVQIGGEVTRGNEAMETVQVQVGHLLLDTHHHLLLFLATAAVVVALMMMMM